MPNVLDIRRRIRSVRNTRQITKAMQMVSAAKLRRAQERAFAARPYAQMLTSVLKSLVSRAEIYDPQTGEALHPLLVRRPENNATLIVVSGEKGLAGAFNSLSGCSIPHKITMGRIIRGKQAIAISDDRAKADMVKPRPMPFSAASSNKG